jgi:hypothetical protein
MSEPASQQLTGESWITTRLDALEDWAQRHSFWP